jgi:hypothetical protein
MLIQIQLVHAEPGRRVVLASAMGDQGCLAMALGEADTAEAAEDRARSRLQQRLEAQPRPVAPSPRPRTDPRPASSPEPDPQPEAQAEAQAEQLLAPAPEPEPEPEPETASEPAMDPEDWSAELANLELQLRRLGWSREQESTYLLRAFGHGSRARLTRYSDLVSYLRALEGFSPGDDPASCPVPLRRTDLLSQCDQLLRSLHWDASRGRQLLETHFDRSSRQQLSDAQLLEFNMLLEGELLSGELSSTS